MNVRTSLSDYIKTEFPSRLEQYSFNPELDKDEFFLFLSSIYLRKDRQVKIPSFDDSDTYYQTISSIVSYLFKTKSNNILTTGYKSPSSNCEYSNVSNPYINLGVKSLKTPNWNLVYNIIGKEAFLDIVFNKTCYYKDDSGRYLKLWGSNSAAFGSKDVNRKVLYSARTSHKVNTLLKISEESLTSVGLMRHIFGINVGSNIPKKYRKMKKLLDKVIVNDKRCRYNHIFSSILNTQINKSATSVPSTDQKDVLRVVLSIVGKLFPLETWGSQSNKRIVIESIVSHLKAGCGSLKTKKLSDHIKITSIKWLGKTETVSSKQDHEQKSHLFAKLLEWLLVIFVPRIVRSFWYVTLPHSADTSRLLYFPHQYWNQLREKWLDDYIQTYLIKELRDTSGESLSLIEKYNYGHSRIIPKSNDFRLICVPGKLPINVDHPISTSLKEKLNYNYWSYTNLHVRPIRQILNFKKLELEKVHAPIYPRCNSSRDVAMYLKKFRLDLLAECPVIPKLYFLKFDMKHCYDTLNTAKVMECVRELFGIDDDNESYFVRQYSEKSDQKFKKIKVKVMEQSSLQNLDLFEFNSRATGIEIVDKTRTIKFSKSQILRTIEKLITESLLVIDYDKEFVYRRKHGVFQGFPLSATFCDLVYSKMVGEVFECLRKLSQETLLLRVADDFLVISKSSKVIMEAQGIIDSSKLHKYGAYVNKNKTCSVNSESPDACIKFVGLQINIKTLEIQKDYSASRILINQQKSFESTFRYLKWSFNNRLESYLIDLDLQTPSSMLSNVKSAFESLTEAICSFYFNLIKQGHKFYKVNFEKFLLEILEIALTKFKKVNNSNDFLDDIIREFLDTCEYALGDSEDKKVLLDCVVELSL